jgi:hypothetical protein
VNCGEVLAKIASSGNSSSPHLHFDLARPRSDVPLPELPSAGTPMPSFAAFSACGASSILVDPYDVVDSRPNLWAGVSPNNVPILVCHDPSALHGKTGVPGGAGTSCSKQTDCRPTLICSSAHVCEPPREVGRDCQQQSDCEIFLTCTNNLCTRSGIGPGGRCGTAELCGPGLECTAAQCTWAGVAGDRCSRQTDCEPQFVCSSAGLCATPAPLGARCQQNPDCAPDLSCDQNACTRHGIVLGGRCDSVEICGPGLNCVNSQCAPAAPPQPPSDCPPGQTKKCVAFGCYTNGNGNCVTKNWKREEVSCDPVCAF